MGNEKELFPKSTFRMCITTMKKVGDEDGKQTYVASNSKWIKYSGKKFRQDYFEAKDGGENMSIEIVDRKPESFKINQIYMLRDRKVVWVWTEEE